MRERHAVGLTIARYRNCQTLNKKIEVGKHHFARDEPDAYGGKAMSAILLTQHMTVLTTDTLPPSMIMTLGDMILMRIAIFEE
ncbi:MAG: hypothetical protein M3M87_00855 [Thermoproteota archaeon]|nr:hypothetical protein [Thermoproteota archaeon]